MIAHSPTDQNGDGGMFAKHLLALAAEVEAAEAAIKQAVLDAARAGDMARVITIVERWRTFPPVEVLKGLA